MGFSLVHKVLQSISSWPSRLQMLWKMLGTVQLIVHLPMLAVSFPANAALTFALIIDLANLKIIPVDKIVEKLTGIPRYALESGYTDNFLQSMGLVILGIIIIVAFLALVVLVLKLAKTQPII